MKEKEKQTKNKNKKSNKPKQQKGYKKPLIKVKKPLLLFGLIVTILFCGSLFFSNLLETKLNLFPNLSAINDGALEVHFVDVGQGDAILVRFPNNYTMLIDSGPASAKENLIFYINNIFFKNDISKTFNYVLLTHSDADHSGNMVTVLNNYNVINFLRPKIYSKNIETNLEPSFKTVNTATYDELILKLQSLDVSVTFFESGLQISEQGQTFATFYSPNVPNYSNTNDYSPIMILESFEKKIMLTGDATSVVEKEVINNYHEHLLDVDVLKLGHHGSKTSTSLNFLEVVKPEFAVISVSSDNNYGHPSIEVLNNIYNYSLQNSSNLKDNVLTTSEQGNIIFYVNINDSINFITIKNAGNYLYIEWWKVVIIVVVVVNIIIITKAVRFKTNKASNI